MSSVLMLVSERQELPTQRTDRPRKTKGPARQFILKKIEYEDGRVVSDYIELKMFDSSRVKFELLEDVTFVFTPEWAPSEEWRLKAEKGFQWDGASVPKLLWNLYGPIGRYNKSALAHDLLYVGGLIADHSGQGVQLSRKEADMVMKEISRALGVWGINRSLMYIAVRLGGSGKW